MIDAKKDFHPDDFRMTVGEHLEDLRRRLIYALVGFVIATVICLFFGKDRIIPFFCKPLTDTLYKYGLPTQVHSDEVPDVFATFLEISLICAAAVASPWILWQFWQFIAAGLFPHERRIITKYIPLSITLLISGMVFVYVLVLAVDDRILHRLQHLRPVQGGKSARDRAVRRGCRDTAGGTGVDLHPIRQRTPALVREGQIWYDLNTRRVEAVLGGELRVLRFSADNLIATEYKLDKYIDLVVGMLITFGLSFQLPLVVLALVRVGIVERQTLKTARTYVYSASPSSRRRSRRAIRSPQPCS